MSLYGALFGGVSGLRSQSSKIGVISDNIANVNTVGYKQSQALFETLVINSSASVSYQTGGVRGESRMNVDKQGLLLSTDAPTDIAISGTGFFTVNAQIDGSGQPLYTRAGSFRQDSLGNFVNAQGFYLQGWPLDREGRLPGEPGNLNTVSAANLDSLQTVNIESASGIAQATSQVQIGANLDAGQVVYPGQSGLMAFTDLNSINYGITGDAIIASDEFSTLGGLGTVNDLVRGDRFEVVTGSGLNYEYEYGGFTVGRDVTTGNVGDGFTSVNRLYQPAAPADASVAIGDNFFDLTINSHGLVVGDQITLTGFDPVDPDGGGPILNVNVNVGYTLTAASLVDANTVRIFYPGGAPNTSGAPIDIANPGTPSQVLFNQYSGNIFDATNENEAFFGQVSGGTTRFTTAALSFNVIRTSGDTHTFTYSASPNVLAGQFNNLTTLAQSIDEVVGLTARIVDGRLLVGPEDATEGVRFTNGSDPATTSFSATQVGIDWITELDLEDVSASSRRFNSLNGIAALAGADDGVTAVVNNPLASASLELRVDDPLDTILFRDVGASPTIIPSAGAGLTVPAPTAGTDLVITLDLGVDPLTLGYQIGDRIMLQNFTTDPAVLSGFLPNSPGLVNDGTNSFVGWEIAAIPGGGLTTLDFIIPGRYVTAADAALGGGVIAGDDAGTVSLVGQGNQGSLIAELGLVDPLDTVTNTANYAQVGVGPQNTGVLGPAYNPAGGPPGGNMASGDITAQFSRNVRIYDALGAGHDIRYSFIKTADNEWAVEIHAIPEGDISSALPDGQIAIGNVTFNGDGSLRSVTTALTSPIQIVWNNGAIPSDITLDWGTAGLPFGTPGATLIGDTDGLSQFDSDYNVAFVDQNGAPVGELVSVIIDEQGFVIASYTNGETQSLYKLPIAEFTNPNGLAAISGNVFSETRESGVVNLREAGTNGVGDVVGAALEQSNVELSEQLTDMIVAQRAYQSNTRVVSVTDELLEELNRL
jgi:flagellar hook-basal body protein